VFGRNLGSVRISKGLKQAYELQDFTYNAAIAFKNSLAKNGELAVTRQDAAAIRTLVSAWADCQKRVTFHRGKGGRRQATKQPPAEGRPLSLLERERPQLRLASVVS
jgi:hypothetical protein